MKKKFIYISLIIIALIAAAAVYVFIEFNRKNKSLADGRPDFIVQVDSLANEFQQNASLAEKKYLGKIIELTAPLNAIEQDQNKFYTLTMRPSSNSSAIRCSMDSTMQQKSASLLPNQVITVTGVFTGYNADELGLGADLLLNRCILK